MTLSACQHDSNLRSLHTTVIACAPTPDGRFGLRLTDTILYAEGGGQPADRGSIGGVPVEDVQRIAGEVVHFSRDPVTLGPTEVLLDWDRRFDHMQQHTAQHLLSALAADHLGRNTVGFHLGPQFSTVDLDGPLSPIQLRQLEELIRSEIANTRPIRLRLIEREELAHLPVRSRGIPADAPMPIRLVEIVGIDLNTCGGTHLSNTAQLELVRLVGTENLRGGVRIRFLAGGRAWRNLQEEAQIVRGLSLQFKCAPEDLLGLVGRQAESLRLAQKELSKLRLERARERGARLRTENLLFLPGADLAELTEAANAAGEELLRLFVGEGCFVLAGPRAGVVGPEIGRVLAARGGGKGRFQGKFDPELLSGGPEGELPVNLGAALRAALSQT